MSGRRRGARARRVALVALVATAIFAGLPSGVSAHSPTPLWGKRFAQGAQATYRFGVWPHKSASGVYTYYTVDKWVKDKFSPVIERRWADPQTNNSNGPRFTLTTGPADVTVFWSPFRDVNGSAGWLGTADTTTTPLRIWLRSNVKTVGTQLDWCENSGGQSRCPLLARAAIHEIGHIGSLAHSLSDSWTDTRMHVAKYPFKSTESWDATTIGSCDEAALQLRYDVDSHSGPYAKCLDHVPGAGPNGLYTDLTVAATNVIACANQQFTVTGRLSVRKVEGYGPLGGNVLASRTLRIDRVGGKFHQTETKVGTGDNWGITFSGSNVTYRYVVQWETPSTQGLTRPPPRSFTIRWLGPQLLC